MSGSQTKKFILFFCLFSSLAVVSLEFKYNLHTSEPRESIKFYAGEIHFARIPV